MLQAVDPAGVRQVTLFIFSITLVGVGHRLDELSLRIVAAADQQPEARLRNLGGRNADLVLSVGYAVSVERDAARLGRELLDQMRLAEVGIDEERVGFDVTTTEATKDHLPFSAV